MMKFDIIGRRKIWYILSILIILPGIFSIFTQGFNLGIDFTGGVLVDLEFNKPVTVQEVRDVLKDYGLDNSMIQLAGAENGNSAKNVMIRTSDLEEMQKREVLDALKEKIGDYNVLRTERVGAVMGSELTWQAIWATLLSWVLIVAYISYRFELKFAIAAIVGLIHDIFIVLSVFSIFQKEIDASFVAALMTIVGYSTNDTIVIFDRIRENLKLHYRKGGDLVELADNSIWQTMTRSIYTVLTVLFTTAALYFFGGETTKNFSFALLIGFTSGAYSSIFTSTPLWVTFRHYADKNRTLKA
ncbi:MULTISPECIES: protein translocase subunit SecF [Anaerosinus]|uniref:Protein-export membrane protein SecF n=1 Tax=Selenobaculum gibii TaxID=3054208 RepID=A0A9Y2ES00_9FIRM|nr:protein translocase subunit SecF [Selenobaculum gbiensis]WIW71777.1 protein translocase subunit SecF [Selenobaculum gbiensis]